MTELDWPTRLVAFLLGGALIVDAVFVKAEVPITQTVIGLVLMGLVPVDVIVRRIRAQDNQPSQRQEVGDGPTAARTDSQRGVDAGNQPGRQ